MIFSRILPVGAFLAHDARFSLFDLHLSALPSAPGGSRTKKNKQKADAETLRSLSGAE